MKIENKSDVKIFILYLLKHADEPFEFNTINDLVLQDEFVNYFDFALCFSELLDAGQIDEFDNGEDKLYAISDSGMQILEGYESSLLPVIRERALKSAVKLINSKRTGERFNKELVQCDGGYMLKLTVSDKKRKRLALEFFVKEESDAQKWFSNLGERYDIIYRGIHALLSGDVDFIFKE